MGSLSTADVATRPAGSRRPAAKHSTRSAMRIVRPQPAGLRCRVRLADGRVFTGALPPARHRAIQLGMLHAETAELVELTPGTRSADGKLALDRRRRPEHYLPGGAAGRRNWLAALLAHAEQIVTGTYAAGRAGAGPREEAFVGVAPRTHRRGDKHAIPHSRFLWVDATSRLGTRCGVGSSSWACGTCALTSLVSASSRPTTWATRSLADDEYVYGPVALLRRHAVLLPDPRVARTDESGRRLETASIRR